MQNTQSKLHYGTIKLKKKKKEKGNERKKASKVEKIGGKTKPCLGGGYGGL